MGFDKYKLPLRQEVIREITKRGVITQRKDETGTVVKKKNINGPSSMFGWGTVDDTIPVLKKDLDNVRRNFDKILAQALPLPVVIDDDDDEEINALFEFDKPSNPDFHKTVRQERAIKRKVEETSQPTTTHNTKSSTSKKAKLVQDWYDEWSHEHDIGSIGLVPQPYQGLIRKPHLEDILKSDAGSVLLHFCKYVRNKLTF